MIKLSEPYLKSTIENYEERDQKYVSQGSYYFFTGSDISVKEREESRQKIKVGSIIDLKKQLSLIGKPLEVGIKTALLDYNIDKTVFFIDYTILNDDYKPWISYENSKILADMGIDFLLAPLGSITLATYVHEYQAKKIPILFPVSGSPVFRKPELSMIVNYRATYTDELKVIIPYVINNYKLSRFAFFYQHDMHGGSVLENAHEILRSFGIQEWLDVPYYVNDFDFTKQIKMILSYQPEAIGFISVIPETRAFIRQMGQPAMYNYICFGTSLVADRSVRKLLNNFGVTAIFPHATPNPELSTLEIAKEYRKIMDEYQNSYRSYGFEGYIAASLFLDALSHIKGPFSREKLLKIFESYKGYEYKGLTLTFEAQTRSLSQPVWLDTGKGDWIPMFPEKNQFTGIK